jgi:excisionase family DNA binding protein
MDPQRGSSSSPVKRPLVTVEEAANLLGESRSTFYRAIKDGTFPLPVYRIGRRMKIPRLAVERLIAGELLAT